MNRFIRGFLAPVVLAGCGPFVGTVDELDGVESDSTDEAITAVRPASVVAAWNQLAIDTSGIDHRPGAAGEQLGPHRSSRAMAIVHIAIFDALNAIGGKHSPYTRMPAAPAGATVSVAVAQAAHDTLSALYPNQHGAFDALLTTHLAAYKDGRGKTLGVQVGQGAARAILARRANDGSAYQEPIVGVDLQETTGVGQWRPAPTTTNKVALGAYWGKVTPFVVSSSRRYRPPAPPAVTSAAYALAYAEEVKVGGDGTVTPTQRTPEQLDLGIFWAYDGTPSLCAPPRLYNQIAMTIARARGTARDATELSRFLALINVAMADAAITTWESKYFYNFWRPVTGIRVDDGNPLTREDPSFLPIGAPASNTNGPNFTPPFPAYPSGHAAFGGALFETLRNFYGTDALDFDFVSDEFNGHTAGSDGVVRPFWQRHFSSLSQAEEENGQSRMYLGIHWGFDKTAGISLGRKVSDSVFENFSN
jgi:hypothetical protein